MRFSQRIGKTPVRLKLQIEFIDENLKNGLWNNIIEDFFENLSSDSKYGETQLGEACRTIWKEFWIYPIDEISQYKGVVIFKGFIQIAKNWFFKVEWFEIYDFIEFLSTLDKNIKRESYLPSRFSDKCNLTLKVEVAGYRIINEKIVQITSEEEVVAIEEGLSETKEWNSVHEHLRAALDMLADRKTPDYRNSIKESISAVEAICIIITGDKAATLGKALTVIEKKYSLHNALKTAFSAIYGYTSDASGIRHSLIEEENSVGFDDAKFMLVLCSAFISYLKSKMKT